MKKKVKLNIDPDYFCKEPCCHALKHGQCDCKLIIETPKYLIEIDRNILIKKEDENV